MMTDISEATFKLLMLQPNNERTKIQLTCIECGSCFYKRENTKIDNLFCSAYCQDAHDLRRYYKILVNRRLISNAGAIAMTLNDYYGGYSE